MNVESDRDAGDSAHQRELHDFETRLRDLRPITCDLSRDQLMFEAGRQSVETPTETPRTYGLWRHPAWCAAASALVVAALAWAPSMRSPRERIVERIVYRDPSGMSERDTVLEHDAVSERGNVERPRERTFEAARAAEFAEWNRDGNSRLSRAERRQQRGPFESLPKYLAIRNAALEQGVDSLPRSSVVGSIGSQTHGYLYWRQLLSNHQRAL